MSSLFGRTFITFLISFTLFLCILAFSFNLGLSQSITGWTEVRETVSIEEIKNTLLDLYEEEGALTAGTIENKLIPYINRVSWLYVFGPAEEVLFSYRKSSNSGGGPGGGAGAGRNFFQRHSEDLDMVPLKDGGGVIGYVSAGMENFAEDRANREFLSIMNQSMIIGAAAALCLSLLVSYFFSRRLSFQTREVSRGIAELTLGKRDVEFAIRGPRELVEIGEYARTLQARLEREEALRRQWASDIAHDLRTPITAVKVQVEGLIDGVLTPDKGRFTKIYNELGRIDVLVEDLSSLTKIESPELTLRLERVHVSGFIKILSDRFLAMAKDRGIALEFHRNIDAFTADQDLLLRGISNLLLNAVMYSEAPEPVICTITGEESDGDGEVVISVTNYGKIPEEELPVLFDRLLRGEKSRSSPGSGLGLTIAKAIAKAHGGSIRAENREDGRVLFQFRLPRI